MKVVVRKQHSDRADFFSLSWMSKNLDQEGYEKTVKELLKNTGKVQEKKELSKGKIGNEWKRLSAFMKGKK